MLVITRFGDKYECDFIEPEFSDDGRITGFSLYSDNCGFIIFINFDDLSLIETA